MTDIDNRDSRYPPSPPQDGAPEPIILVVEDDPPNQILIEMLLRSERLTPLIANDIEHGWRILQENPISLVISDLHVDALTLIKWMRADPATANIPIIIETGERSDERRYAALEAGASNYFIKPYPLNDLVGQIRKCLADNQA